MAVLRLVAGATRQLHPASDCFRGAGYAVTPKPQRLESGRLWGCFRAERGRERLDVCEHVEGAGGTSWPDVSAWYWPALLGRAAGPFRAITRVMPATD